MATFVDDELVMLQGDHLGEVLAAAREHLRDSGRIITEVCLGGRTLKAAELDDQSQQNVAAHEVRLYTTDPRDLVHGTMQAMLPQLDKAVALQGEAAQLLQQDCAIDAMTRLGEALSIWQQAQEAVMQSVSLAGIQLEKLEVDGASATAVLNELIEQLRNTKQTIEDRDFVALADALAYEWPEVAERWHALLQQLSDCCAQA